MVLYCTVPGGGGDDSGQELLGLEAGRHLAVLAGGLALVPPHVDDVHHATGVVGGAPEEQIRLD